MMASHTSNSMEIDQFPHPASTNSSRRFENLPSIGAVFKDLPPLNNNPVSGFFGTGPESEPRVPGSLPLKKWGPSDSDRPHYNVPKQQHNQLHSYTRQHHNHPYFQQPENSSRCHSQHLQLGSRTGRRSGVLETPSQHFYTQKSIDRGNAREPEYSWGAERAAASVSGPGLHGASTSSHVQQRHQQPQHQQQQQPPLPPPPPPPPQQQRTHCPSQPPPPLSPINSWANGNRPEHSGSPQLSPTITEGYSPLYSVNDSDAGNDKYSENGDSLSDLTNSVHGDSYSHTGSIGPPYVRQFSCAKCKAIFKCDSLRR
ncbi:hypothetical protein HOY82DRAFT_593258 [Tuber indicum]|nr:hypothetical protein HOY82DRAFT_593258 [Tuber indicum]